MESRRLMNVELVDRSLGFETRLSHGLSTSKLRITMTVLSKSSSCCLLVQIVLKLGGRDNGSAMTNAKEKRFNNERRKESDSDGG